MNNFKNSTSISKKYKYKYTSYKSNVTLIEDKVLISYPKIRALCQEQYVKYNNLNNNNYCILNYNNNHKEFISQSNFNHIFSKRQNDSIWSEIKYFIITFKLSFPLKIKKIEYRSNKINNIIYNYAKTYILNTNSEEIFYNNEDNISTIDLLNYYTYKFIILLELELKLHIISADFEYSKDINNQYFITNITNISHKIPIKNLHLNKINKKISLLHNDNSNINLELKINNNKGKIPTKNIFVKNKLNIISKRSKENMNKIYSTLEIKKHGLIKNKTTQSNIVFDKIFNNPNINIKYFLENYKKHKESDFFYNAKFYKIDK